MYSILAINNLYQLLYIWVFYFNSLSDFWLAVFYCQVGFHNSWVLFPQSAWIVKTVCFLCVKWPLAWVWHLGSHWRHCDTALSMWISCISFIMASVLIYGFFFLCLGKGFSRFLCLPFKHVKNEMITVRERKRVKILGLRNFGRK